jgi:hypothetical protein
MKRLCAVLSLVGVLIVLVLPAVARAADPAPAAPDGWTWDEMTAPSATPDGWTWDEV